MTLHILTGYMGREKRVQQTVLYFCALEILFECGIILFHLFVFDEDIKLNGNIFCKMVIVSLTLSFPFLSQYKVEKYF